MKNLCWAALIRVTAGNVEGLDVVPLHQQEQPRGETPKLTSCLVAGRVIGAATVIQHENFTVTSVQPVHQDSLLHTSSFASSMALTLSRRTSLTADPPPSDPCVCPPAASASNVESEDAGAVAAGEDLRLLALMLRSRLRLQLRLRLADRVR